MAILYRKQLLRDSNGLFLGIDFKDLFNDIKELETKVLIDGRYNVRGYPKDANVFFEEIDTNYSLVKRFEDGHKVASFIERREYEDHFPLTIGKRIKRFVYSRHRLGTNEDLQMRIDHYTDRVLDIVHLRKEGSENFLFPNFGKDITEDLKYRTENLKK